MISIGNFFFRFRNALFPVLYALLFIKMGSTLEDFRVASVFGFFVAFLGQSLRAITIGLDYIVRGGRNRSVYAEGLVSGGVFAHCRNPLYVGNFLIIVGLGIASNSPFFLAVVVPSFAFIYMTIIAAEENYLLNKFGSQFQDYCSRVNRLVPDFRGFKTTISGMKYNWRRLITAEYGSAYIWVAGMLALTLRNAIRDTNAHSHTAMVKWLWIGLAASTLGYIIARFLKKSGRLNSPKRILPETPMEPVPQGQTNS